MSDVSVAARLNNLPLGSIHRKATFIIGAGLFFEFFDLELSGVLSSVIGKEFHITASSLSLLLSSAFFGMFLGAVLLNGMADKIGRKKAFMVNLLIYSVFTFAAAFSPNAAMLVICRFLAGIGIGALPPLCDTYLSELLPVCNRGRIMAWAYTLQFCAFPIEGLLARCLVPLHIGIDGWRWLFIIGSLGAMIAWALQQNLPESPRWLEAIGRKQEAEQVMQRFESQSGFERHSIEKAASAEPKILQEKLPVSTLFNKDYRGRTAMLWVFQIFQSVGYYSFGTLVPLVLAAKGYNVTDTLTFTALTFLGYPLGSLISLPIVERIQRKWLIVLAAFFMALFGILFGISTSSGLIIVFGFLYTLVSNIFSNAYHIFQVEIYPTSLRATGAGVGYSLSRLSSGAMPFILVPLLNNSGSTALFTVVAVTMVIIMLDIGIFAPNTTSRSLEEVNQMSPSSSRNDNASVPY
ncbi:putative MFS transporter [Scopulibacillus daqui]|uniref:MFS transporter n=1 Tax=Scopulibacillus daqui TaxID=1469162 RepID=A0ABS2Q1N1_9BACL|nr:putative MFS transporter [Scopulibacillus daqui]